MAAACQAARIMQELDMDWERLEVEHFGGDLECADTQARSSAPLCGGKTVKQGVHYLRLCWCCRVPAEVRPLRALPGQNSCGVGMPIKRR